MTVIILIYFIYAKILSVLDLPMIVSGNRLACFEPQEKVWKGEVGQAFSLASLIDQSSDFITSLHGLAGFDKNSAQYQRTIFRLPLRTKASSLSDKIYNTQKLQLLLDALREEAKYLLLFLKSVCKIQVVHISQSGQHSISFCVEISPASLASVTSKRKLFMQQLRQAHSEQPYSISRVISFTATFSVIVTDNSHRKNQAGQSNWVIANSVGSEDSTVQAAAAKQCTFPWVGTVLELGTSSVGGRIFCFLPMPMEATSGLPVHVNGTFGLNDERRTLKWPGIERRNDPTANWNKILVSQLLPPCYAMLLVEAKKYISHDQFYNAWPDVNIVNNQFSEILHPLFSEVFQQAVVWTEKINTIEVVGNWILISQATFISEDSSLPSIVKRFLTNSSVYLVEVPSNIWRAMYHATVGVTKVSPMLVRSKLRTHSESYSNIDPIGKRVMLTYCLSDSCYNDLQGLNLLPLANGSFTNFDTTFEQQTVFLCSDDYPRSLLPNLDHLLVDVSDYTKLQQGLYSVADSQQTKLRLLTERDVASLLSQALPSSRNSLVSMPHSQIPSTWLQTFWNWLQEKNLRHFAKQILVPCYISTSSSTRSFCLAPLSSVQDVIYVRRYSSCSSDLLSAIYKMNIRVCLQSEFSYIQHKQLSSYIKQVDANNLLDAIGSTSNYNRVAFTAPEADSMRMFLVSSTYTPSMMRTNVLKNICIFSSASNSLEKLFSVNTTKSKSVARQVIGEPNRCAFNVANLPSNLIILSRENYYQLQLLTSLRISFLSDFRLLVNHVFPLLKNKTFPDHLIDKLMPEVLDMFQVLNSREYNMDSYLQSLQFVKTTNGRKSPSELFTPFDADILALYSGEDVFPQAPYNTKERVQTLRTCGLCVAVTPQQVLDIIYSVSCSFSSNPQRVDSLKLSRAKAVLKYISTPTFYNQTGGRYVVANDHYQSYTFSTALNYLATSWSWLPILSDKPSGYPEEISWKGHGLNSHFISLSNSMVLSPSTENTIPCLVGSQVYIVCPAVADLIANMLPADSNNFSQNVVAHYKEILSHKDQLSADVMNSLVLQVYDYMNSRGVSYLASLYSITEWIYIKKEKKFIAPDLVALKQNSTFKRDLEPYIYVLPDILSQYSTLFGSASRVAETVSQAQIVSVLKMIKDDVQANAIEQSDAWSMIMNILNWLTNDGNSNVPDEVMPEDVLVPVETESKLPQLVQVSEVVYTDNEFLKDYLQSSEEKDSYQCVHNHISASMAHNLGAVPLAEFLDISEDAFEDAGQHEPLTTRLKNILRDYKDGLTIIKELLQNADDAEATEVNICYDTRQHETNKLFFSGMAEAHGPALIVHNNKCFSEDDFTNITKLAGATKANKVLKIGKFGIGFCSVYHMTDVPSFVSRDKLYIFDPTLSYLRKDIKNFSRPGKKVLFTSKFIANSRQLSPYDGLFGFDRSDYKGTIFRLPFRTHPSELSSTCYSNLIVQDLISAIKNSSSTLLLFLQHVRTITFQTISHGQSTPEILLKITRERIEAPIQLHAGTEIRELTCFDSLSNESNSCHWLVSQESETDDYSQQYFTASVSCPLGTPGSYSVDAKFRGEIFCFLPLSQKIGLPVHLSSNFAVINNRRGIWTSDEATSLTDREVTWNVSLMQGVIPRAYFAHLLALKDLMNNGDIAEYVFHCLWPDKDMLTQRNPWEHMIDTLYSLMSEEQVFYSACDNQWLYLTDSKFLEPKILCLSTDSSTPMCVLKIVEHLKVPVVDLPQNYHIFFDLDDYTVGEKEFIDLFFQSIDSLASIFTERNKAIQYMLEQYMANIDRPGGSNLGYFFKTFPSIPCCPHGEILRKCNEIIDPKSKFSDLFDESDALFPVDMLVQRELSAAGLKNLGMLNNILPWNMLLERATSVPTLYQSSPTRAMTRTYLVISASTASTEGDIGLSKIPFLPVLTKPPDYFLPWKETGQRQLMCGEDLMIPFITPSDNINVEVSGSQAIFVNNSSVKDGGCGPIDEDAIQLLGIRSAPTFEEVVLQLNKLIELFSLQECTTKLIQLTDKMCRKIYEFFNTILANTDNTDVQSLRELACIWTGEQFITISVVATKWSLNGPYLYPLPASLSFHTYLTKHMNIKEEFTMSDIQIALAKMKEQFGSEPISEECQNVFNQLLSLLISSDAPKDISIMLPDENYVMHPASELSFNDAQWAPKETKYTYVHGNLARDVATKFGVVPIRTQVLERFSTTAKTHFNGTPFGQHEELTRRIQNILKGYPLDITVLKELLQNADDSGATKMYVILDKRTHGAKCILSETWGKLQGPALLVWNDSEFSEKDLEGIQQLGLGSKRSDDETIGQYGIGFNVVYHLTDCPSFITGGETMCILDPHCHYVPGATASDPGRRFDNLVKDGFWDTFSDMKGAYLQSRLENCPPELQEGGSLFRFPLRHTPELVAMSKILKKDTFANPKPLKADDMHSYLKDWAPGMKEAMLFLNHITELRFFVIEKKSHTMITLSNYRTTVNQCAQVSRVQLHNALSAFKQDSCTQPTVVRYPITISTVTHKRGGAEQHVKENWLIQQGVGDIENEHQTWKYISNIKPRHGIAAPICEAINPGKMSISGKVFCFLPLPVDSNLPVHINGHFVLDSNRRDLWHSTDSCHEDDRAAWNRKIFEAIASSYANLLEHAQQYYVTKNVFKSIHDALDSLNKYYSIFPHPSSDKLEKRYLLLAESVYTKFVTHNSSVLSVAYNSETAETKAVKINWCPIKSELSSTQVYFWSPTSYVEGDYERKSIRPLLEAIGMQLTAAPSRLKRHLNKAIDDKATKLQETNPSSVYAYYQKFNVQAIKTETGVNAFPCAIDCTIFKRAEVFRRFTDYLLQAPKEKDTKITGWVFPDNNPYGYPLLLTADSILRNFEKHEKVLRSEFSGLFKTMLHLFIHPKLLKANCNIEYFAENSDYEQLVSTILASELPPELQASRVQDFDRYMSENQLKELWKCFSGDVAFKSKLNNIVLKLWALIPTNRGHLYSTSSKVLPVYPLSVASDGREKPAITPAEESELYHVLSTLQMPFIALPLGVSIPCPRLKDRKAVLKNLYFLNQEVSLSKLVTKEMVKVIFDFATTIDFRSDPESLNYIKSLPLFENVDGEFSTVQGKTVFKWNTSASTVGYKKWIKHCDVIFLHCSGAWTAIGSAQLAINSITGEGIYSQYIFKFFDSLNETERYEHLEHIRDVLFRTNKANSQEHMYKRKETRQCYFTARTFINLLEALPCISEGDEPLRPVRDFCDHTLPIFTTFRKTYRFLPAIFTSNSQVWSKWKHFFQQLHLRQTLTKEEFVSLCQLTAESHDDPKIASQVLLEHYFSVEVAEKGWTNDLNFNKQVSNIAFVPAQQLPQLSWIKSPFRFANPGRRINKRDGKVVELTKMNGAAMLGHDHDHEHCLWTIMPIVSLPIHYFSHRTSLYQLGVTIEPTIEQVVNNLKNISSMAKFTGLKLFDNYPPASQPPEDVTTTLMEVIECHFTFLQNSLTSLSTHHLTQLENIPCIPVPSTADKDNTQSWQVVLVKPCYVLSCTVEGLHPFLHSAPSELNPAFLGFLQSIGVDGSMGIKHCQLVLETAYKQSQGQKLDENTKACVVQALKCLHKFLKESDHTQKISPLYLPSNEGTLVLSTELLYADTTSLSGHALKTNLDNTGYSLINLTPLVKYGFSESQFCELLPKLVRPKGMSELCEQKIIQEFKHSIEPNEVHKKVERTLCMKIELPRVINAVVNAATDTVKDFVDVFTEFVAGIDVVTVKRVQTLITLRDTGAQLGQLNLSFHLQHEQKDSNERLCLYLDSNIDPDSGVDDIVRALSKKLIKIIKHLDPKVNDFSSSEMARIFTSLLRLQTPAQLHSVLKQEAIPYTATDSEIQIKKLSVELGKEIPTEWHHRLDQAIDNVFHPGELVGYEDSDDHIIFAQIMHSLLPKEGNLDSVQRIDMRYRIYTSLLMDDEGIEVGILELYKFVRGLKFPKKVNEAEKDTVTFEGETEQTLLHTILQEKDLEEVISDLKKQLDDVWRLSEEDRRKAIKRLYLKWHPDKNSGNQDFAEKVFKFLISEIEARNTGRFHTDDLNETARRHRNNLFREHHAHTQYEYSSSSSNARGASNSSFSRGREFGNSGWGTSSQHESDPFGEENVRPQPKPDEGKRWLKQAEANFDSLRTLFDNAINKSQLCGDVCFIAHQVAEKALKGGKYFVCGLDANSLVNHNISTHAYGLQSERPGETHGLVNHTTPLEKYYLDPRYPNRWPSGIVPADMYNYEQAEQAKDHAEAILRIIKNIIDCV